MSKIKGVTVADERQRVSATRLPRLAYGIDDAADAVDLSRSRIYELIASGEITACKIGKRTIIPTAELTAFLERHRVERPSSAPAPPTLRSDRRRSPRGHNEARPAAE